ncbi:hypothetical protein HN873_050117 [Arachis hypogaea]
MLNLNAKNGRFFILLHAHLPNPAFQSQLKSRVPFESLSWVNTGILNAPEVEDIAKEYLNELVMVAKRSDGGVKSCRIHDLLLDICISESKADKDLEFELSKF